MEFYKYYSLDNEYSWDALINEYFYFSSPSQLNDPFDCKVNLVWKGSFDDTLSWLSRKGYNVDEKSSIRKIHNLDIQLSNFDNEHYKAARDGIKVFSASTNPDSILMWSHYTHNHTGICVNFKTRYWNNEIGIKFRACNFPRKMIQDYPQGFLPLTKVKYQLNMPKPVNMIQNTEPGALDEFIYTKHNDWKYENEYRASIYFLDINNQKLKYHTDTIKEIIFGMDCSESYERDIMKIFNEKKRIDIKFKKALPLDNEYGIRIVDYP